MKFTLLLISASMTSGLAAAQTAHAVRGYTRSDGTYVAPHYQSNADSTRTNNYSSQPNINPYTGQAGTIDPYAPKPTANPYEYHPYKPRS